MAKTSGSWSKENPGPGRPLGSKDKLPRTVKETVLKVFNELQGDPKHNLKHFAEKYPRDFYAIAAKLIPTEVVGQVKSTIQLQIIRDTATTIPHAEFTPEPAISLEPAPQVQHDLLWSQVGQDQVE